MSDASGTTERTYDALNRNITKTVPNIGKSTYQYDLPAAEAGEYIERTTDPKGNITEKTYDKVGRLSKVTVGGESTDYNYYLNGNRYNVTYPDGTKETYEYDRSNHVTKLVNRKKDGSVISSYAYTYDEAGNQLTKTEQKGTTTYTYDKLNRLGSVAEPSGKITSYTYDGAGNRKSETIQNGLLYTNIVYNYNNKNQLISMISSGGTYSRYTYDNNGNMISKSSGNIESLKIENITAEDLSQFGLVIKRDTDQGTGSGDLTLYTYDHYNRLTDMKTANTSASYQYNAQGYRVKKTVNGSATNYLYEADKVILETDGAGKQTAFQAYGTNLLYRFAAANTEMAAQSYYYLYNAHGDVTSLIDKGGKIAATYDYDAFGTIISKVGNADNHITYSGYQQDDESGLYYLNARYYDSVTARFLSEDDPKYSKNNDPLSLNLYTYCHNEPIKCIDPTGHMTEKLLNKMHDFINKVKSAKDNTQSSTDDNKKLTSDKLFELVEEISNSDSIGRGIKNIENFEIGSNIIKNDEVYNKNDETVISDLLLRKESTEVVKDAYESFLIKSNITEYQIDNPAFVAIDDNPVTYFGGNQDWFGTKWQVNKGCGAVAAANILTYMAMSDKDLSSLYGYNLNNITKADFTDYMEDIYKYMPASIVGILEDDFVSGVLDYAKDKGIYLDCKYCTSNASYDNLVNFISNALQNNHPVAFLNYFNPVMINGVDARTQGTYSQSDEEHWVVITGMSVDEDTEVVTLEVSTWGDKATISLDDFYEGKDLLDVVFPSYFIYFEEY